MIQSSQPYQSKKAAYILLREDIIKLKKTESCHFLRVSPNYFNYHNHIFPEQLANIMAFLIRIQPHSCE